MTFGFEAMCMRTAIRGGDDAVDDRGKEQRGDGIKARSSLRRPMTMAAMSNAVKRFGLQRLLLEPDGQCIASLTA